jgi:hypothetical protein
MQRIAAQDVELGMDTFKTTQTDFDEGDSMDDGSTATEGKGMSSKDTGLGMTQDLSVQDPAPSHVYISTPAMVHAEEEVEADLAPLLGGDQKEDLNAANMSSGMADQDPANE